MAAQQLPQIQTKFSFAGLKEAAQSLEKLRSQASNSFSRIRAVAKNATEPLKKDLDLVKKAAKPAFAAIQLSAKGAERSVRSLASATASAAKRGISGGLSIAAKGAAVAGLAGGLSPLALSAGLRSASNFTGEFVQQQQKFAAAAGTSVDMFQRLSFAARRFGAENDDLQGGLSSLTDKIKESTQGGQSAELFNALGIPTLDQFGRLRDSGQVLLDLIDRTKGFNSTQRAGIFNELLGGDAEKLSLLLNSSRSEISALGDEAQKLGVISSPQQVELANQYNSSLFRMREAFRGVALDIGTRFLPVFTDFSNKTTKFLSDNRDAIGSFVARSYNRLVGVVNDIVRILKGQDDYVQNDWLLGVRDRLVQTYSFFTVTAAKWLATAKVFTAELFATLAGQDQNVMRFPWLLDIRDGAIAALQSLIAFGASAIKLVTTTAVNAWSAATNTFADVKTAVLDVWELISQGPSAQKDLKSPAIEAISQQLLDARAFAIALFQTLTGEDVTPDKFKWLNSVRDALVQFVADAKAVFDFFGKLLAPVEAAFKPIFKYFNTDLTQILLFSTLLQLGARFTLVGKLATGLIGTLAKLAFGIGGGAAAATEAAAGAASATGGVIGLVGRLGLGLGGLTGAFGSLATALAPAGPLALAIAGITAAVVAGKALIESHYNAANEAVAARVRANDAADPRLQAKIAAGRAALQNAAAARQASLANLPPDIVRSDDRFGATSASDLAALQPVLSRTVNLTSMLDSLKSQRQGFAENADFNAVMNQLSDQRKFDAANDQLRQPINLAIPGTNQAVRVVASPDQASLLTQALQRLSRQQLSGAPAWAAQ